MADAIAELEKDFGTHFPVYRFRSSPPKKKVYRHSSDGTMSRRKVDSKKHRHPRKKVRHYKVKKPTPRICTSLLVLDETWRLQTKPSKYIGRITETGIEFQNRLSIPLHPQFVKAGIIHRPPAMNSVMRNYSHLDYKNSVAPFSSQSCSDEDTLDDKLTCLEGPPAQFAKYEYFYCDLDVEWYVLFTCYQLSSVHYNSLSLIFVFYAFSGIEKMLLQPHSVCRLMRIYLMQNGNQFVDVVNWSPDVFRRNL
jgi:hypothetical protein